MHINILEADTKSPLWDQIKKIRYEVFVTEQKVDEREEYDEFEETSAHLLALVAENPAGTCRWTRTSKGFKLERFAVRLQFRKAGVGSALLQQVLAEVLPLATAENGMVYLHAQVQALPFYKKHGFEPYGDMFSEAGIDHYAMQFAR